MHRFRFEEDDLFINRLKTYPEYNVFIYQGLQYTNNLKPQTGPGGLTVFDINSNRSGADVVKPRVNVTLRKDIFKRQVYNPLVQEISDPGHSFKVNKNWKATGADNRIISSSYPSPVSTPTIESDYGNSSPIKRRLTSQTTQTANFWNKETSQIETDTPTGHTINVTASALLNVARKYNTLSDHFIIEGSSIRSRDLLRDDVNFIFIPSMYYGSSIKKGSVELNYFITGSKLVSCADINHDGTLIETTGSGPSLGNVVGLVLYDEGIIMLTSSAIAGGPSLRYNGGTSPAIKGSWLTYGTTLNDGISHSTLQNASYDLNFKGTSYVNSMTMFAHAKKGHLNHSNNPTYRDTSETVNNQTGSGITFAQGESGIKNIVSASFSSASFDKTTYISKINLYDENENFIGVASLATPVKKTIDREYLFKLKLDI